MESASFAAVSGRYTVAGQPAQRYRKTVMRPGRYVSNGRKVNVTERHLAHWAATFAEMKAAGVKVPVPHGHPRHESGKEMGDADGNRGWVQDLFVDGDELVAVIELIGADSLKAAARSDVSVYSPPEYRDGTGRSYKWPITHIALVTDPVVSDLGEFVPLAASVRGKPMDLKTAKRMAKLLGVSDELTEENYSGLLMTAIKELKKGKKAPVKASVGDDTDEESDADSDDESSVDDGEEDESQDQEPKRKPEVRASRGRPQSPMLLRAIANSRTMALDALVEAGKITPAVRKKLLASHVGTSEKGFAPIAMSIQAGGDGSDFDAIVDVLRMNKPVKFGEKSGPQTLEMSNGAMDDPNDNPMIRAAANLAGVKVP